MSVKPAPAGEDAPADRGRRAGRLGRGGASRSSRSGTAIPRKSSPACERAGRRPRRRNRGTARKSWPPSEVERAAGAPPATGDAGRLLVDAQGPRGERGGPGRRPRPRRRQVQWSMHATIKMETPAAASRGGVSSTVWPQRPRRRRAAQRRRRRPLPDDGRRRDARGRQRTHGRHVDELEDAARPRPPANRTTCWRRRRQEGR